MTGRVIQFPFRSLSTEEGRLAAERVLSTPIAERSGLALTLRIEEPETLLAVCGRLRTQLESAPQSCRDDAEYFYNFIEKPRRPVGLFDEREYFLGELALTAGTACRLLSRREEAWRWFDRSEAAFRNTVNAVADWSRLSYQRLALRMEERQFDEVLELLPSLLESFENLDMREDALKCRFLEGIALMESDRPSEAIAAYREMFREAISLGSDYLASTASYNIVQLCGMLGDAEAALAEAGVAFPLLRKLDNRVGLAKLQWGLGGLLRTQGKLAGAVDTYREAQRGFQSLGMRADVAALHLVIADLLLELGQDAEARDEILAALPIIDEEKMVNEGAAALLLLRESLRRQEIDRASLRELHGYFDELNS